MLAGPQTPPPHAPAAQRHLQPPVRRALGGTPWGGGLPVAGNENEGVLVCMWGGGGEVRGRTRRRLSVEMKVRRSVKSRT